jgi:thiol:disulfide interchange protein
MTFFRFNILTAVFIVLASCQVSSASKDTVIITADTKTKPGIQFIEEDWAQALKTAKDKEKLIFLDIYATWCGPCKMLKQYTFTDSSVENSLIRIL